MKRKILCVCIAVASVLLTGCFFAPVIPPGGVIYSNVGSAIDTDADQTKVSPHVGRASSKSILGLVAWGNSGIDAAAAQGNLVTVNQIDYEYYNILLCYQKMTIVVHGEKE